MQAERSAAAAPVRAWIVLPGHRDREAHVDAAAFPFWSRVAHTAWLALAWGGTTTATFLVTLFDPFMTALPLLVGAVSVWKSWRGRWHVRSFRGGCPRCGTEMTLEPGVRIDNPHPLVCYSCHHEPQLVLAA